MREKHPEYGFYSNSPNLKKLEKNLTGTYKVLFYKAYNFLKSN
jgi:hypothetical protein